MKLTVEIDNTVVSVALNKIDTKVDQLITNTVTEIGNQIVDTAQQTTKFRHGSHFNQGIIFQLLSPNSGVVTSQVYNSRGQEYSNYLEFGNQPVTGKKMTFQIDGQWITTYHRKAISTQHLGFMTDAKDKTISQVEAIFTNQFNQLFQ